MRAEQQKLTVIVVLAAFASFTAIVGMALYWQAKVDSELHAIGLECTKQGGTWIKSTTTPRCIMGRTLRSPTNVD